MKVSTFIERPVLSAVISITIMVAGIIGLFTSGRGDQRRGRYDLHDLHGYQLRYRHDHDLFPTRNRSGHGRRKRTEPCIESDRAIAGRGYPSGCHDFQAPDQYVTDLLTL